MVKVSVIMPSYNHGKFIVESIQSILNQSFPDLELIIVDDFSIDNSRDIIQNWAKKDPRIKVILHSKNEGIAKTCNDGLKSAKGKYIAMMASDDTFKKNAFQKLVVTMDSLQTNDVAIIEGDVIDTVSKKTGLLFSDLTRKPDVQNFFNDLINGNFVCTGMVKKSLIDKYEIYYDETLKYLNDWVFWLTLSKKGHLIYINEPLYNYRMHSAISSRNTAFAEDHLRACRIILEKFGSEMGEPSKNILIKNAEAACHKCLHPSPIDRLYTLLVMKHTNLFKLFNSIRKIGK